MNDMKALAVTSLNFVMVIKALDILGLNNDLVPLFFYMNRGRDIISKEMVVISIEIIKIITQERAFPSGSSKNTHRSCCCNHISIFQIAILYDVISESQEGNYFVGSITISRHNSHSHIIWFFSWEFCHLLCWNIAH